MQRKTHFELFWRKDGAQLQQLRTIVLKIRTHLRKNNLLNHVEQLTESPIEADALYEELSTQFHKKDIDQIVRRMLEHSKLKINALNLIVKNST